MYRVLLLFISFVFLNSANGKSEKSTVVLLSIDGFAYNYLEKYQPKQILAFAKTGTTAKLFSVYPSKTFPNHLSIITGVYPQNHGIIHNNFYHPTLAEKYRLGAGKKNSSWLTAQPFWSFTQEQGLKSAVYFWPELQAKGQGRAPNYFVPYNRIDSEKKRFDQVIDWLKLPETQAPHFIASYFSSIDSMGHKFGVGSPELAQAITAFDNLFGHFIERLQSEVSKEVNVILLSDHGMVNIDKNKQIDLSRIFNKNNIELIKKKALIVAESSTQLYLYFDSSKLSKAEQETVIKNIKSRQLNNQHLYNVYRKNNYPDHWHLNNDIAIIPDVIIEVKLSASFRNKKHTISGTHGYDPLNQNDLDAIFIAAGPNIAKNRVFKPFENIHIVPFMSQLLSIKQPNNIDGDGSVLKALVR